VPVPISEADRVALGQTKGTGSRAERSASPLCLAQSENETALSPFSNTLAVSRLGWSKVRPEARFRGSRTPDRRPFSMSIPQDKPSGSGEFRRWRFDPRRAESPLDCGVAPGPSGRWVVVAIVSVILVLWLGLDLSFRAWKARYRALVEYGETQVAPVIDPLASEVPPDVAPTDWQVAVSETHAMLLALVGSGVLDRSLMDELRREIAAKVAAARPETARRTLADLWDDLERKAGPVIAADLGPPPANSRQAARHPRPARPKILGPFNASTTRDPSRSP
jgi:hypothetical protein